MQPATTNSLEQPDNIARELRAAVLAGEHARAQRLATEYTAALPPFWAALPESERVRSPIPDQARELLAWAREMTLVQRALTAEHLAIVEKASRYGAAKAAGAAAPAVQVRA